MTVRLSPAAARRIGIASPRGNKYGARKVNGFDSQKEAAHYQDLLFLAECGQVEDLRRQPQFHCWVRGRLVCKYRADFLWTKPESGEIVIEDVKGFRTREYRLKKKLVEALFGVEIQES